MKLDAIIIVAIINGIFALAAILMPFIANKGQDKRRDSNGLKQAVRSLLYSDLERRCFVYIQQGYISAKDFKLLLEDWNCYHEKLKGNGYLDELMNQVKGLPIQN